MTRLHWILGLTLGLSTAAACADSDTNGSDDDDGTSTSTSQGGASTSQGGSTTTSQGGSGATGGNAGGGGAAGGDGGDGGAGGDGGNAGGGGTGGGAAATTIQSIQTAADSATCPPPNCAGANDNFCNFAPVLLENLVAISPVYVVSATSNLMGFYAAEATGTNRAILINWDADDVTITGVVEGSSVTSVVGAYSEIFCVSQVEVEMASDLVVSGTATLPATTTVSIGDLSLANGEPYESIHVSITDTFTVTAVDQGLGLVTVEDGSANTIDLSNAFGVFAGGYPAVNHEYSVIGGITRFFRDAGTPANSNFYLSPKAGDLTDN